MEVSKSKYLHIEYHADKQILKAIWQAESERMTPEDFMDEITIWKESILKTKPTRLLVDSKKMFFTITPDVQTWFVTEIFPAYAKAGVARNAFIESESVYSSVSIEQTIEENANAPFETRYFMTESVAIDWLMAK